MSSTPTLELPGYQVIQFLGSGARSTIWEVRNTVTNEVHALKRVVKRTSEDSRFLEQAINEYEATADTINYRRIDPLFLHLSRHVHPHQPGNHDHQIYLADNGFKG